MTVYGFTGEKIREVAQQVIAELESDPLGLGILTVNAEAAADGVEAFISRMWHVEYDLRGEKYDPEADRG